MAKAAGDLLIAYLSGKREPSVRMKLRAIARRRAEKAERDQRSARARMRLRALAIIKGQIGTVEKPMHSNVIKYTKWWGWGAVAYCVIGMAWSGVRAGSKAFRRGARWANTDVVLADAKAGRNGLHLLDEPCPAAPESLTSTAIRTPTAASPVSASRAMRS